MPLAARALLAGLEGSRVTPRIFQLPSFRNVFATEEPYELLVRNLLFREYRGQEFRIRRLVTIIKSVVRT